MLTIEQIESAHEKVQSGADFPRYVQDLITIGVVYFNTEVADGHSKYCGREGEPVQSTARYDKLEIATTPQPAAFAEYLNVHQQGKTDFMQFCRDCAKSGITKWSVDFMKMTCTYFDIAGNVILTEPLNV